MWVWGDVTVIKDLVGSVVLAGFSIEQQIKQGVYLVELDKDVGELEEDGDVDECVVKWENINLEAETEGNDEHHACHQHEVQNTP